MRNAPAGYRHFHDELALLKQRLLDMSERAESLVALSVEALLERDRDKAIAVIEADEELDRLEVEAENQAIAMLALQQPMARDLRFLIGAIKVSSDLERVGDHAVNIAQCAVRLVDQRVAVPAVPALADMARRARAMLSDSLDAFIRGDGALGRAVGKADDDVDAQHEGIFRALLADMMGDPQSIAPSLELLLVSRNLERVADLATNIGEDAVYLAEGKQIRHRFDEDAPTPSSSDST
ncbi:phosphate signaling complex protein PhoU [Gemmatimonas groenlandica]|uniref:Phosphate-specific transport system accessory protein PhoU n=1 Tax=Gemmatimonas groenlandica TaxID=2732249 RepID=A0A6M4IM42_9BACT|nr:phosphate signaling complex protein PhoU [Gemmatimonas groenlandica]QJR34476.1 phosphate signaling complex protein PhoU [Gemmatimonas groenlandica]